MHVLKSTFGNVYSVYTSFYSQSFSYSKHSLYRNGRYIGTSVQSVHRYIGTIGTSVRRYNRYIDTSIQSVHRYVGTIGTSVRRYNRYVGLGKVRAVCTVNTVCKVGMVATIDTSVQSAEICTVNTPVQTGRCIPWLVTSRLSSWVFSIEDHNPSASLVNNQWVETT